MMGSSTGFYSEDKFDCILTEKKKNGSVEIP